MELDKLDLLLIEELTQDARQPVRALARKLEINRETVRYRLNRLMVEGILTINCASNLELLGYDFLVAIGVNVYPGKVDAVASRLALLPSVYVVCLSAGRYNIVAWALLRNRLALANFVSKELSAISDIATIELMQYIKWFKDSWRYFQYQTETARKYPRERLSPLDSAIIKAVQKDPRQTMTKLAKTVGCSRAVARTRLEELINDSVIRFVTIVNPPTLRYDFRSMILVKSRPDKVNNIADELSAMDATMHLSLITGQWQIIVVATFKDAQHIYSFMAETLASIPGILEFEFVPLGKMVKYSSSFIDSE